MSATRRWCPVTEALNYNFCEWKHLRGARKTFLNSFIFGTGAFTRLSHSG